MKPTSKPSCKAQIRLYQEWLRDQRGLTFTSHDALWRWSTTDLDAFWQSIWDYFEVQSPTPHRAVLACNAMPGDRVAAYLPNVPEAMVAFLAIVSIVSIGGVRSICAPDMGMPAVLDRFLQIAPMVLIACNGVTHGGRDLDRLGVLAELQQALPGLRHTLLLGNLDAAVSRAGAVGRDDA